MTVRLGVRLVGGLAVAALIATAAAGGMEALNAAIGVVGLLIGYAGFEYQLHRRHDPAAPAETATNLPSPGLFVGRSAVLKQLDKALAGQSQSVVVHALHGMGGIGKSTLAATWARRNMKKFPVAWWIAADSPARLEEGLAGLATAMRLGSADASLKSLSERATQWLAEHDRWLLILDNVTHVNDVKPLLDRIRRGRVLITSRLSVGWHRITDSAVPLEVMEASESERLLRESVTRERASADLTGAAELCAELGFLPLGIEQAAAYMAQSGISPVAYHELLERRPEAVLDVAGENSDPSLTVARTWSVTLDRLIDTYLAGEVLRILAWYAHERIPCELLAPLADPPNLDHAVGRLGAYHLVKIHDDRTLSLHPLVQTVSRTPSQDRHRRKEDIDAALFRATELLSQAVPDDYRDPAGWPTWRRLLPHITALADHAPPETDSGTTADLLGELGVFLLHQGSGKRALALFERVLTYRDRVLGPDHPDTLKSSHNLATAYSSLGEFKRSITMLETILAERERVQGPDHPETLTTCGNLAEAYLDSGDIERAISLHERTLAGRERMQGPEHPDTLLAGNNLAHAYLSAGDIGRAIALYERNLADCERVLGTDHPDTLNARHNLAGAYREARKLDRAIALYERNLADCERVLGTDHPDSLNARSNLAVTYRAVGEFERSIAMDEQTLAERIRVLGADHRATLISRSNLATAYLLTGSVERALPLHEQTLADCERVLGTDHPDTLNARHNLAGAYREAGQLDHATALLERTVAERKRVLGADHPDTLTSRSELAHTHLVGDDLDRATRLLEHTLADRERVLGADHPDTLTSRSELGEFYLRSGNLDRAVVCLKQALVGWERVLGAHHTDTFVARGHLLNAYIAAGDFDRVLPLLEQTAHDCERIFGRDHPVTKQIGQSLADAKNEKGIPPSPET